MNPMWKKYRKIAAWIAVTSLTLSFFVGDAYSRVLSATSAAVVHTPVAVSFDSDCLVKGGQTILVSDWSGDEETKSISILVSRPAVTPTETLPQDATGATEENAAAADELTVILGETAAQYVTYEAKVSEEKIDLTLTRIETEPVTEVTRITIDLAWNGLSGTVCMNMLPVPVETEPPTEEPTEESTATESAETEATTTESTATESAETEATTTESTATEPAETEATTTESTATEPTATEAPTTEPTASEPTATEAPTTEPTASEPTATEAPTTEPTASEPTATEATTSENEEISLADVEETTAVTEPEPTEPEKFTVSYSVNGENAVAYGTVDPSATLIFQHSDEPLYGVRFSFDGENYFLLYDINAVTLAQWAGEEWNGSFVLDLTCASADSVTVLVQTDAQIENPLTVNVQQELNLDAQILTPAELPHTILTEPLWADDLTADISAQKLTKGEDGTLLYSETDLLIVDGLTLTGTPEPGSYRVVIKLTWKEISIMEQHIYYFINMT